jgi:hypothetical protein
MSIEGTTLAAAPETRRGRAISALKGARRALGISVEPVNQLAETGELAEARYVLAKVREALAFLETSEELLSDLVADKENE